MTSTTSWRPVLPGGPFATAVADDDADGSDGARESGPGAPPARSTAGARTGSGRPTQKCCTANPTATTSTRTRAASAFGSVPHRNCTQSGSRSRTAHHARSTRRARGGSCPEGGRPASAALPASPKIAATRARTLSRSHSRRSAPPDGAATPFGGSEKSDAVDAGEETEGSDAPEAETEAEAAPGPGPSPKPPDEAGNPHDADRDKFIPTDAKHPAPTSLSSVNSGG